MEEANGSNPLETTKYDGRAACIRSDPSWVMCTKGKARSTLGTALAGSARAEGYQPGSLVTGNMASSSNGSGNLPFKQGDTGSNPVGATKFALQSRFESGRYAAGTSKSV